MFLEADKSGDVPGASRVYHLAEDEEDPKEKPSFSQSQPTVPALNTSTFDFEVKFPSGKCKKSLCSDWLLLLPKFYQLGYSLLILASWKTS